MDIETSASGCQGDPQKLRNIHDALLRFEDDLSLNSFPVAAFVAFAMPCATHPDTPSVVPGFTFAIEDDLPAQGVAALRSHLEQFIKALDEKYPRI